MRLDNSAKGQLTAAIRKVQTVLALQNLTGAPNEEAHESSSEEEPEDPQQEVLEYPRRLKFAQVARAVRMAQRLARAAADSDEDVDEDVDALVAAQVAMDANPNVLPAGGPHVLPHKPEVHIDPVPPQVTRPLRVGSRTFRPAAGRATLSPAVRAQSAREASRKGSARRAPPSRPAPAPAALPRWQQVTDKAPTIAGGMALRQIAFVVDTDGLEVGGGSLALKSASRPEQKRSPLPPQRRAAASTRRQTRRSQPRRAGAYAAVPPQDHGPPLNAPTADEQARVAADAAAAAQAEADLARAAGREQATQGAEHGRAADAAEATQDETTEGPGQGESAQAAEDAEQQEGAEPEGEQSAGTGEDQGPSRPRKQTFWTRLGNAQAAALFNPSDHTKAMKKLRRSVVGSYIKKDIRFGVKELRQVLTADVTATALNSDVHVHERGALYEYMRDMARLHDRVLSGHGNSDRMKLLYVTRDAEIHGRRRSLHPSIAGAMHASRKQEPTLLPTLRKFYSCPDGAAGEVAQFYTDAALLRRESIRFHSRTVAILQQLWRLYDEDGSGYIDEEEYVVINKLVQRVLMANFDAAKAEAVARMDWVEDSQGYYDLNYERFASSWFQLADLWTSVIDVDKYCRFLSEVLECLSYVDAGGTRRLRNPRAVLNLKKYRKEKKKQRLGKMMKETRGVAGFSIGRKKKAPRVLEDPPVASADPALLEEWRQRQLAAGFTEQDVDGKLAAAKEAAAAAAAAAEAAQAGRTTPEPWREGDADAAPGKAEPWRHGGVEGDAGTHARLVPKSDAVKIAALVRLATPKKLLQRTRESIALEQKRARLATPSASATTGPIAVQGDVGSAPESAVAADSLLGQQGKATIPHAPPPLSGAATATVSAGDMVNVGPLELPVVYGRHNIRARPPSQRGGGRQRPRPAPTAGDGPTGRSERDDRVWAAEWVEAQRVEAARVKAARQAAEASQGVSVADIDKALHKLQRMDAVRPAHSSAGSVLPSEHSLEGAPWSSGQSTRIQRGRPLSAAFRANVTRPESQGGEDPDAFSGAAVLPAVDAHPAEAMSFAPSEVRTSTPGGTAVPASNAVLAKEGNIPGWLRYTTMMLRTMPLSQVMDSLYAMGPEAASQVLPLIAAESDHHSAMSSRVAGTGGAGETPMRRMFGGGFGRRRAAGGSERLNVPV